MEPKSISEVYKSVLKTKFWFTGAALLMVGSVACTAQAVQAMPQPVKLTSPNGQLVVYFDVRPEKNSSTGSGRLVYSLQFHGKPVLEDSGLALELDDLDDIPAAVVASVEGSLERLGRDSVEIVYLHNRVARRRAAKPDIGVGARIAESTGGEWRV